MADVNNNQNGVFGGIQFGNNVDGVENTSYFDGLSQNNSYGNEVTGGVYGYGNNNVTNQENVYKNIGTTYNSGLYGNVTSNAGSYNGTLGDNVNYQPIPQDRAIAKQGIWSKIKAFLFQEIDLNAKIKVELTPYQQKVENEINEFLHQEVSFKGFMNLFKGKK